jgi:probable HAF family extracellular repeat protein
VTIAIEPDGIARRFQFVGRPFQHLKHLPRVSVAGAIAFSGTFQFFQREGPRGYSSGVSRGFVRASDGTITSFDPTGSYSTTPAAMNDKGTIVGYYYDANSETHGFVRTSDGTITSSTRPAPP